MFSRNICKFVSSISMFPYLITVCENIFELNVLLKYDASIISVVTHLSFEHGLICLIADVLLCVKRKNMCMFHHIFPSVKERST